MFELRTAKVFVLLVSGDLSSKLGGVFRLIEEAVLRKIYSICDLVFVKQVVVVGGAFAVEKALLFELFSIDCTRLEVIALGRFGRVFLLRVEVQKINRPGIRNIVFKIETLPKIFFFCFTNKIHSSVPGVQNSSNTQTKMPLTSPRKNSKLLKTSLVSPLIPLFSWFFLSISEFLMSLSRVSTISLKPGRLFLSLLQQLSISVYMHSGQSYSGMPIYNFGQLFHRMEKTKYFAIK